MAGFARNMERETLRRMGHLGKGLSQFSPPESFDENDDFNEVEEPNYMPRFPGFPEIFDYT